MVRPDLVVRGSQAHHEVLWEPRFHVSLPNPISSLMVSPLMVSLPNHEPRGVPLTPPAPMQHFLTAQNPIYPNVLAELRAGEKRTHWMWFIFPQLEALGRSPTARHYGLKNLDAAQQYLADPVLGARLRECVATVLAAGERTGRSAHAIFGSPDDLKFRSCLTLFAAAASTEADKALFSAALARYYDAIPDPLTLELLG
jgi:uncharacterized protein (DUF1810 family)